MDYSLGIDLGTSGVKAGLLNLYTLRLEFVATREYDDSPEQDPEILWEQTIEAVKESVRMLGGYGKIRAIGLSGQMHGAILYNDHGELISPIITWKDQKWSSNAVIDKIKLLMEYGNYDDLGTEISSGYSGAILVGIKETDPGLFQQIAHFIMPVDFLRGKLMGENSYATDPTNAFGTGLFNTKAKCWHRELIGKLELPFQIFPEVHETSQIAGGISQQIARVTGLEPGIPIIYSGGDNQMSMLGSGLFNQDSPILLNIGTAAQISKVTSTFQRVPEIDTRSYFNGCYAFVGASLAGGSSYRWLRERIRESEKAVIGYAQMDALSSTVTPGADGLVYCSGPTRQNLHRRNGFCGNITRIDSIGHRARAVMEGVLMDLYDAHEILRKDDRCGFIMGAGKGLQRSRVWSQISADMLGKPLRVTDFENAVFGAALNAAMGVGAFENLDGPARSIQSAAEMIPEPESAKFYRDEFVGYWRSEVEAL